METEGQSTNINQQKETPEQRQQLTATDRKKRACAVNLNERSIARAATEQRQQQADGTEQKDKDCTKQQ